MTAIPYGEFERVTCVPEKCASGRGSKSKKTGVQSVIRFLGWDRRVANISSGHLHEAPQNLLGHQVVGCINLGEKDVT